jgi:GntR family transcriptional regulator, sialic acid-inducible nan operon repressor
MERFGIGRPAIRESQLAFEKIGLIAPGRDERTCVVRLIAQRTAAGLNAEVRQWFAHSPGIRHLQAACRLFAAALSREAALSARDEDIGRLGEALAVNLSACGNPVRFERIDIVFHDMRIEIAGNPIFTTVHQAMIGWLIKEHRTTRRVLGAEKRAADRHQSIFAAVATIRRFAEQSEPHHGLMISPRRKPCAAIS